MLSFGEKIAKIGPADPEIICLREIIKDEVEKKKDITEGKIHSLSGKFALRAKLMVETCQFRTKYNTDRVIALTLFSHVTKNKTRNAWQSLVNSPLGATVSPPSN